MYRANILSLKTKVAVIPCSSVLLMLDTSSSRVMTYLFRPPSVRDGLPRSNRTLGDPGHAVLLRGLLLMDAVKVDCSAVVWHGVVDVHNYGISFGRPLWRVDVPTVSPLLCQPGTSRLKITYQSAMMVGPGMEPLMLRPILSTPSGATVEFCTSNQYSRVTPVSGVFSYQFVDSE